MCMAGLAAEPTLLAAVIGKGGTQRLVKEFRTEPRVGKTQAHSGERTGPGTPTPWPQMRMKKLETQAEVKDPSAQALSE